MVCLLVSVAAPQAAGAEGSRRLPRRALWIETSANLRALSSREGIRALVVQAREAGIDTLIPEAKNAWGFVTYDSDVAPHIGTSPVPVAGYPAPVMWYPRDFDALRVLIEEAHAAGLSVHAAVNAFGEGLKLTPAAPLVGTALFHPDWVSIHLRPGPDEQAPFVPSSALGPVVFANPVHPEAQLYEMAVLWEIMSRYDVDGIVLDRARYAGLDADFSDLSRKQFEAFLGQGVRGWPEDILQPSNGRLRPGPLFPQWVAWRASVIKAYARAAARLVRRIRPGVPVGMYVGAWYPTIYEVGQNWARSDAPPIFAAWTPAWGEASLLSELDYLMVGLYYRTITRWDAARQGRSLWTSVVGGAMLSRELTQGTPVLGGVWLDLYKDNPTAGEGAIRAAVRLTDGLMIFDLSNVRQENWWSALGVR